MVHNEEVKERPILFSGSMVRAILEGRKTQTRRIIKFNKQWHIDDPNSILACPYGVKGDRLWVRESCWIDGATNHVHYCATDIPNAPKKTPSIFMPRCASRITLEVVGVRVERLQDISAMDCISEGIERNYVEDPHANAYQDRQNYKKLWESINGPGSWDVNPWIWVIEFKKINKE